MKTEIKKVTGFKPVEIKITIETEREYLFILQFFGSLTDNQAIGIANSADGVDFKKRCVITDFKPNDNPFGRGDFYLPLLSNEL